MAHEKVYAICEDMCLEEIKPIKTLESTIYSQNISEIVYKIVSTDLNLNNCKILNTEIKVNGDWYSNFCVINTKRSAIECICTSSSVQVNVFTLDGSNFEVHNEYPIRIHYIEI